VLALAAHGTIAQKDLVESALESALALSKIPSPLSVCMIVELGKKKQRKCWRIKESPESMWMKIVIPHWNNFGKIPFNFGYFVYFEFMFYLFGLSRFNLDFWWIFILGCFVFDKLCFLCLLWILKSKYLF
jgi:hypothetical protein